MPGLAGIIAKDPSAPPAGAVAQMVGRMRPEPDAASGQVVFDRIPAAVGWVVHPGSFSDCLPVWNAARDVCLVFAGEHFSDGDDFAALGAAAAGLDRCDARWLLAWYEQRGDEFLRSLNGWFSGLLADFRGDRPRLVLFNDRFGLGRVYWHEDDTAFYFASEAKALLAVVPALRALDPAGLGEFIAGGCTLQDRTLFPGVRLLPPGSAWTWAPPAPAERGRYFDPAAWEALPALDPEAFFAQLRDTLARVVPRYVAGRQPVALSLTGGVDSRMILAALRPAPGSLPCYTFGGMYRECADVAVARRVAAAAGLEHRVLSVTPAFFGEFPELAARSVRLTDGTMDVTGAVGLSLNRLARAVAPVRLTGNYGGEILRGIASLKTERLADGIFDAGFVPHLRRAGETLAAERAGRGASVIAFKQMPWHHYRGLALEGSRLTIRSPFLDHDLVRLAFQAPPARARDKTLAHRLIAAGSPALADLPTDRGAVRRPALVPAAAWAWWKEFLPRAEYVYDYGMPQWLARTDRVLGPLHFEKLFLGRQKFAHFRIWYRRELAPYVRAVLLDPATLRRPYLNARRVEEIVAAHLRGTGNYTREIHKLLTVELIQRELLTANH